MSRIEQVMQKAEQDGTARRTRRPVEAPQPARGQRPPVLMAPGTGLDLPAELIDRTIPATPPPRASQSEAEVRLHPLLVAAAAPHSPAAERYRSLRTRIAQVEDGTLRRLLMMTSPGRGEGKSMTTLNLGITMAQEFHRRVIVVDADLRRPRIHSLLGLAGSPGLSDVLLGAATLEDAVIAVPDYRLTLLPAGLPTEQPTELLGSTAMRRLLEQLRSQFDRVIIDTPPVSPLADASVLARLVDAILIVVRAGYTQKPALERTLGEVEAQKLLGLVLNDVGGPETAAYLFDPENGSSGPSKRTRGPRTDAAPLAAKK